jgi:uncharacterized protein YprB with RNaseH-like and TPR domain
MLTSTFVLLQGIGPATERRLWRDGLHDWNSFLKQPRITGLSPDRKAWYDRELVLAQEHFHAANFAYFASRLQRRDHWRFFDLCRSRTLYLDIETTGAPPHAGDVTVVGLRRNGRTVTLVRGETLTTDRLQAELDQAQLLVTFFGTGFDVPYLQTTFPRLKFGMPHFDLCFAARRLGLRGGLKRLEQELGIQRDSTLRGLDGWDAVRLWSAWCGGDAAARDLLLAYNTADVDNLVPLAEHVYDNMLTRFGPPAVGRPAPVHACQEQTLR